MAATPHKATLKRYDGTQWVPVYLGTSADIVQIGEAIEVMGSGHGVYADGDMIAATDAVSTVIKKLVQTQIPPTYTAPSISLKVTSGNAGGKYEAGTALSAVLTSTFTQNDAGAITNHKITKGGTEVVTGTDNPATYTLSETLGDSNIVIGSNCAYAQGPLKQDNFGADYATGRIAAGSKTASNITYTTYRKTFYGVDSDGTTAALTESADIRGLAGTVNGAAAGSKFSVSVPTGSTRVTIAYPATIRDMSKVEYVESGNANVTEQFNKTTANVEGAGGFTAISYKVYTLAWDQPTAGPMTLNVTL